MPLQVQLTLSLLEADNGFDTVIVSDSGARALRQSAGWSAGMLRSKQLWGSAIASSPRRCFAGCTLGLHVHLGPTCSMSPPWPASAFRQLHLTDAVQRCCPSKQPCCGCMLSSGGFHRRLYQHSLRAIELTLPSMCLGHAPLDADVVWMRDPTAYIGQHPSADWFISTDCLSHEVGPQHSGPSL